MIRVLLDSNIYNCLEAEDATRNRIAVMIAGGNIDVVASPVIVDELRESPFGDAPNFFPGYANYRGGAKTKGSGLES